LPKTFETRIASYTERVNACLDSALPLASTHPARLHEAMRYGVFNGGKRVRPLLVYAAGECLDIDTGLLDAPAVAIELIHAFSLIHDDLPAMDDDDLRRGKPTVHIQFDEATAILAADALQPLAFAVLASLQGVPAATKNRLVQLVADACGSVGMTGGQALDLAAEGKTLSREQLEHMYSLKTGALIHASIMSACLMSADLDDERAAALDRFARAVGIAFQIKDDILDVEGETHVIGKAAGADELHQKSTYPALFGLDKSRRRCNALLVGALNELKQFGERGVPLAWLARFIVERGR
jgi:farnesyl diphosphate synthase